MGSETATPASVRVLAVATAILFVGGVALTQVIPREDEGSFAFVPPGAYVPPNTTSTTARDVSGPLATVGGSTTTTVKGKTTTAGSAASGGPATVAGEPRPTATTTGDAQAASTTPGGPANGGTTASTKAAGIYVIAPDGTGFRRVVGGGYSFPTWSPQGDRIAYGAPALRVISANGGSSTGAGTGSLTAPPSWSRDGTQIAYAALTNGHYDLWVTTPNGSGQRIVADHTQVGEVSGVSWSPAGEPIAFAAGGDVWVVNSDGSGLRQLATGMAAHRAIAVSPDGHRVAFTSLDQLMVVDISGPNLKEVAGTDRSTHSWDDISWSPDSTRVAFQAGVGGVNRVRVVGRDGTNPRTIADAAIQPSFAPDGKRVAVFTAGAAGSNGDRTSDLVLANPDRSDFRQRVLYDEPGAFQSWGPAYSPNGRLLLFATGGARNLGPPAPARG